MVTAGANASERSYQKKTRILKFAVSKNQRATGVLSLMYCFIQLIIYIKVENLHSQPLRRICFHS